jgi:hypothetical protein
MLNYTAVTLEGMAAAPACPAGRYYCPYAQIDMVVEQYIICIDTYHFLPTAVIAG